VLIFERSQDDKTLICAVNVADTAQAMQLAPGAYTDVLNQETIEIYKEKECFIPACWGRVLLKS